MRVITVFISMLAICSLLGCQTHTHPSPLVQQRDTSPALTDDYAAFRKQQILSVDYQLSISLDAERPVFNGQVQVDFELASDNKAPITLDFFAGEVHRLQVNGKELPSDYQQWFIQIAPTHFQPGHNRIIVDYQAPYSTQGEGLHRYQDKHSGHIYLYTNFEPFSANKFFPHFDQPNLKARYTLDVTAPKQWHVISATRESRILEQGNVRQWFFPQSARIPSYIFPLHAGDYVVWEDNSGNIPLRLFARQELAEYVIPEEWFTYTHKSFAFFNDYFEFPYPFGKYDQVIVPEFNWGAMENLAAVTFAERFITRGTRTEAEKINLASVIAHEMAHMWFGNITTMDWWNGLWLNESFATYMAYLALDRSQQVEGTWETFYTRIKQWAYLEDQRVTTHAIELPVETTSDAFSNFDGITYGKGASILKQLPYYLGEENFRRGVANYLKKHAYSNTTLEDFIGELGNAAGKDLTDWTQSWLFEIGLNQIQVDFTCNQQELSELKLIQTASADYPRLREQRVQLGLFALGEKQAHLLTRIPVAYAGEITKVEVPANTPCPQLIFPNLDDWGYVKVQLDSISRANLKGRLMDFQDDHLRLMLWESYWDAVQDAQLSLDEYLEVVMSQLSHETNSKALERVLNNLTTSYDYFTLLAQGSEKYQSERSAIETFLWQELPKPGAATDRQKLFFQKTIATSHTPGALDRLRSLLLQESQIKDLVIDQDLRWQILLRLNQFQHRDYLVLTQAETLADTSQRGVQSALAAEARRPDPDIKQHWLTRLVAEQPAYSLDQLRAVMQNLFPVEQVMLRQQFAPDVIRHTLSANHFADDQLMRILSQHLAPNSCTKESAALLAEVKDSFVQVRPILGKNYRIAHHENLRCLKIGEKLLDRKQSEK